MLRISTSQRFCTKCGTTVATSQPFCTRCGTKLDTRYIQKSIEPGSLHSDDTVKVLSYDTDATIKAFSWSASTLYLRAAEKEASLLSNTEKPSSLLEALPQGTDPLPTDFHKVARKKTVVISSAISLALLLFLLTCGVFDHFSDRRTEQQAQQNKAVLDHSIAYARSIGVPTTDLQPVLTQEHLLSNTRPLYTAFHNPLTTNYYQNQARRYHSLQSQMPGIIIASAQHLQAEAQQAMQNFQTTLSQVNVQSLQPAGNIHAFAQQFSQDQFSLSSAHLPKDYSAIIIDAKQAVEALNLLITTSRQLAEFATTLQHLQAAHLDISAMQLQYQSDQSTFNQATTSADFQNLTTQLNAQYQQLVVSQVQSYPYVSVTKLNEFRTDIQSLQTYGIRSTQYQQRFEADEVASQNARTVYDQLVILNQLDTDIASMNFDLTAGEAHYNVAQFHEEVNSWASSHLYHDSYDGHNYALNGGYSQTGIGATLDHDLAGAHTLADFESLIAEANNAIFNLHMLQADYNDHTPFTQKHATDIQMLSRYNLQQKQVLVVSLAEQAMRIYQNGDLQRAYLVTTGRQELPSLPGIWSILDRRSPVLFKAADPPGSPYWFPDTPIKFAILYHYGGYYIHDAPWRANFGPGTQFPHQDTSGTTAYNFDGSHGCINLEESAANWVYSNTDWNTVIVIY